MEALQAILNHNSLKAILLMIEVLYIQTCVLKQIPIESHNMMIKQKAPHL